MYIRDLQSRVQFLRNDLPVGFAEQALQDAARFVARKTGIVRRTVYGSVPSGQYKVNLSSFMGTFDLDPVKDPYEILRPTLLMFNPGMNAQSSFSGMIQPTNLTITAHPPVYTFYVASANLTATDGTNSYPMYAGDVIQYMPDSGGKWVVQPFYKYTVAIDVKGKRLFGAVREPLNNTGYLTNYTVEKDYIYLSPVPINDTAVMMECSVVPKKGFDTVDFPVDAEDAILFAAQAQFVGTPNKAGGGADRKASELYWQKAFGEISLVRAIAEGGYGDTEAIPPIHFGN